MALPGGEGRSVLVGDAVLKPVDDAEEALWCAQVLDRVEGEGFRVARPLRTSDNSFFAAGWSAATRVDGVSGPAADRSGLLDAGRAFHAVLRREACPPFIERREHRWAVADRVAWSEARVEPLAPVADLALLAPGGLRRRDRRGGRPSVVRRRLVALNERARLFGLECLDGELEPFEPVLMLLRGLTVADPVVR